MKAIPLIICCSFLVLQVQAKKLKVCLPKTKMNFNEQARLLFEKTYDELKKGNDDISINGNFSMDLNLEGVISGTVSVSDITISGISNISISLGLLEPTITMNALKIEGKNYNITSTISDLFDLYGNGKFEIDLEGISFAVTKMFPSLPLGCIKFELKMKMKTMKADFENIMGGDELLVKTINPVIGDMGPDFIDYYWPTIYEAIKPYIQKILDSISKSELARLHASFENGPSGKETENPH